MPNTVSGTQSTFKKISIILDYFIFISASLFLLLPITFENLVSTLYSHENVRSSKRYMVYTFSAINYKSINKITFFSAFTLFDP